ncbi:hypothetical protein WICPIJ_008786 [Wickerhamomyces pijperi]|uniref:Uncharacterized protein n=1 Tax=Wickerhamomyces pijperi TaxID=599730 RepID=A0A9P8PVH9_WICPI|nr:hypothetical protein WICPIJ_008786 [Wickerhamomyces pijperi]
MFVAGSIFVELAKPFLVCCNSLMFGLRVSRLSLITAWNSFSVVIGVRASMMEDGMNLESTPDETEVESVSEPLLLLAVAAVPLISKPVYSLSALEEPMSTNSLSRFIRMVLWLMKNCLSFSKCASIATADSLYILNDSVLYLASTLFLSNCLVNFNLVNS